MRHTPRIAPLAFALAAISCSEPQLADLPARCSDGVCPTGYDCIHGVCAKPGTAVPIKVADLSYLRGDEDLRVIPQTSTALITWQTYAYSDDGEGFVGVRVSQDGSVSAPMTLANRLDADPGALEPYFDIYRISDDKHLLAFSAPPRADDDSVDSRLIVYRVNTPPEGSEASGAKFTPAWSDEERMSAVGYGATSRPRFVARESGIELGYFRSRTTTAGGMSSETIGELAVFSLDQEGAIVGMPSYHRARDGLTVAVGVLGGFSTKSGAWWMLDDVRTSALFVPDAPDPAIERRLERLGIGVAADDSSLLYIEPSARTADKLPSDPVTGSARLRKLSVTQGGAGGGAPVASDDIIDELPLVRDNPAPTWITREGKPAILVTAGAVIDAPTLRVLTVDPASGESKEAATIARLSSLPLVAVDAARVGGKLFVAWAEQGPSTVTIRVAIIAEP